MRRLRVDPSRFLASVQVGGGGGPHGYRTPAGPYETLGGFVVHSLGRIPVVGYAVPALGHVFTVVTMDGRRVDRLRVAPAGETGPQPA